MNKDFWNERFLEKDVYGEDVNAFLKEQIKLLRAGANILCIAEGQGRNALYLSKQGFHVTAVDQSDIGINQIKEKAKVQNLLIEAYAADLTDYDFGENKWDAIVSIFGHLPSELRRKVHQKITKGLKKGGLFIMEAYSHDQLKYETGGPKSLDLLLSTDILKEELPDLKVIKLEQLEREVIEGKYHSGLSSVVQYIGLRD
ncbi:class I SAM-dependent methyltransferase [Bacteriovorax stolpii]|uniref:class I SAM-dependent methyltransferase n=1 Tax=Bacteriovorax stolpii TaxID=960 RepID=UPI00163C4A43|nr:class I SAM-dependent methyltransferase [Bacteriovorax stolpii]